MGEKEQAANDSMSHYWFMSISILGSCQQYFLLEYQCLLILHKIADFQMSKQEWVLLCKKCVSYLGSRGTFL